MKLKSLNINRMAYGENKGKLTALIEVEGVTSVSSDNSMKITIPDDTVVEVVRLITPHILSEIRSGMEQFIADGEAVLLAAPVEAEVNQ